MSLTSARTDGWRRIAARMVLGAVAATAAGVLVLANVYQPLREGSWAGADSIAPASLFARVDTDPFGSGSMFVYCYQPNGRFAWGTTLRNDGPLPVTILGGDPGPFMRGDMSASNTFRLIDFAIAPNQPGNEDPNKLSAMSPVTLASGDEVSIWARFEMGGMDAQSGATMSMRSLWVRYSVLGVQRTAEVALRDGVGAEGTDGTCPGPGAVGRRAGT